MGNIISLVKDRIQGLFGNKVGSVIVVDVASDLKLIDLQVSGEIKINALQIIDFVSGNRDDTIVSSLRDFLKKNNIQHKNAVLIPFLKQLYVKRIQLPSVSDAELAEAVKWQVKDSLPFDLSRAALDYQIIKKNVSADGSKVFDIICVAAEEDEIKRQVLLLKQLGLSCLSVSLPGFGYAKLLEKYFTEAKDKPVAIAHISSNNSYLAIYRENSIAFFRSLPITIDKLRESLSAALVSEKGRVQLTAAEINDILFNHGIPMEGSLLYKDKIAAGQILAMLRPGLEMLSQEIQRSLSYYTSQFQASLPARILLGGEAVRVPALDKFLTQEISLPVALPPLSEKIKFSSKVNELDLKESYAGIGSALDYDNNINLLPHEFRTEKIEKFQKVSLRWVSFIACMLLIVSYLLSIAAVSAYQKRLDNALFQLNVLSEIKRVKGEIDAFDDFSSGIKKSGAPFGVLLKKISTLAPQELFFKSFALDAGSKRGMISCYVRSIKGNPDSILSQFVKDMGSLGYTSDIDIDEAKKIILQGAEVVSFNINFQLK